MERNTRRHGEKGRSIEASVRWSVDTACDLSAQVKDTQTREKPKQQWSPPQENIIKVNVDAGFDITSRSGTSGVILRNSSGELIRAQTLWYEHAADAWTMELLALRDGLRLASDLGFIQIVAESDALEVVKLCNSNNYQRTDIDGLCRQVNDLAHSFIRCSISHVLRSANEAAHLCAKQASSSRRRCLWVNYIPSFLRECLHRPCTMAE